MTEHELIGFTMYIKRLCVQVRHSMYALRIMMAHGLAGRMPIDTLARLL